MVFFILKDEEPQPSTSYYVPSTPHTPIIIMQPPSRPYAPYVRPPSVPHQLLPRYLPPLTPNWPRMPRPEELDGELLLTGRESLVAYPGAMYPQSGIMYPQSGILYPQSVQQVPLSPHHDHSDLHSASQLASAWFHMVCPFYVRFSHTTSMSLICLMHFQCVDRGF